MTLYNQVFSSLANKIYNGIYDYNSELPGMNELTSEYGVSMPTLRQALYKLEQAGLISTRQGRRAIVTYSGACSPSRDEYARFIAARRTSLNDALTIFAAVLPPVFSYIAQVRSRDDVAALEAIAAQLHPENSLHEKMHIFGMFMLHAVASIRNTMLDKLAAEFIEYTLLPTRLCPDDREYTRYINDNIQIYMEKLLTAVRNREVMRLLEARDGEALYAVRLFQSYTDELALRFPGIADEPRPFHWLSSPASHYMYSTISDDITLKIATLLYHVGDMLPSESEMCRMYNASTVTVRRAIAVLTAQGLVYTVHGKGCFVARNHQLFFDPRSGDDFYSQMHTFTEALQISSLLTPVLVRFTLRNADDTFRRTVAARISQLDNGQPGDYPRALMILNDSFARATSSRISHDVHMHLLALVSRYITFCSDCCRQHPEYVLTDMQLLRRLRDDILRGKEFDVCRNLHMQLTHMLCAACNDCVSHGLAIHMRIGDPDETGFK